MENLILMIFKGVVHFGKKAIFDVTQKYVLYYSLKISEEQGLNNLYMGLKMVTKWVNLAPERDFF